MKDLRYCYLTELTRAEDAAMNISHSINCICAFRENPPTWGDVGMITRIADKLEELLTEIESYERLCTVCGNATVDERRAGRRKLQERMAKKA